MRQSDGGSLMVSDNPLISLDDLHGPQLIADQARGGCLTPPAPLPPPTPEMPTSLSVRPFAREATSFRASPETRKINRACLGEGGAG